MGSWKIRFAGSLLILVLLALGAWFFPSGDEVQIGEKRSVASEKSAVEEVRTITPEIVSKTAGAELVLSGGKRTEFPGSDSRDAAGLLIRPPALADEIFSADNPEEELPDWIALRDRIEDAMVTYSQEGLDALKPLLSHPNARVRAEAMDAIMQMDVPGGGAVLREAAKKATSAVERSRLEEAADFCDLPSISAEDLRRLVLRSESESNNAVR